MKWHLRAACCFGVGAVRDRRRKTQEEKPNKMFLFLFFFGKQNSYASHRGLKTVPLCILRTNGFFNFFVNKYALFF